MDNQDLQQIKGLFDEQLDKQKDLLDKQLDKQKDVILNEVATKINESTIGIVEFIEQNVLPVIEENRKAVVRLPDKAYLDNKMADLTSDVWGRLRKEDEKVNRLVEFLRSKNILNKVEVAELQELIVFPRMA